MKIFYPLTLIALVLVGCGGPTFQQAAKPSSPDIASARPVKEEAKNVSFNVLKNRDIVRSCQLGLRVDKLEAAEKQVTSVVTETGGYIESSASSDLDSSDASMEIHARVPIAKFDSCIGTIEKLGVRLEKRIDTQDVTAGIYDFDARLKSLRATEEGLRAQVKRAKTTDQINAAESQLASVRTNIEALTTERKGLVGQAMMSTLTLKLQQGVVIPAADKDPNWTSQTWAQASAVFGGFVRVVLSIGIWLVVFSPVWLIALFIFLPMIKRAKLTKQTP